MKLMITRACGHEEQIEVFGPNAQREKRIIWEEKKDCKECYNKAVVTDNKEAGMATLTGSEKQIAWAEKIRAKAMAEFAELDKMETNDAKMIAIKAKVKETLMTTADSSWWIDHRDNAVQTAARNARDAE